MQEKEKNLNQTNQMKKQQQKQLLSTWQSIELFLLKLKSSTMLLIEN